MPEAGSHVGFGEEQVPTPQRDSDGHFGQRILPSDSLRLRSGKDARLPRDSARQPVLALQLEQRHRSKHMPDQLRQDLQGCSDAMFVLESALHRSLQLTGAPLGNIQLMDWRTRSLSIVTQHGFNDAFLRTFRRVTPDSGSACGRAIRTHAPIVIGDVLCDPEFAPYRALALENGFRAVQSTPLVSSSGAFLGVVSTHFPVPHRPSDREMLAIARLSEITANALIRQRAIARATDWRDNYALHMQLNDQLERARTTVERSHKLLQRLNHKSLH